MYVCVCAVKLGVLEEEEEEGEEEGEGPGDVEGGGKNEPDGIRSLTKRVTKAVAKKTGSVFRRRSKPK